MFNPLEWLEKKKQEIDARSKMTWVDRYAEKHGLTDDEIASFVVDGMERNEKVQKLRYDMFSSHIITTKYFLLFFFFAWAFYPRLGDLGIPIGFGLSLLLLYGRSRILQNRLRKYVISNWKSKV